MTDRERFTKKATEMGATVMQNDNNTMMVISNNGMVVTMYSFTEDGKFVDFITHQYK